MLNMKKMSVIVNNVTEGDKEHKWIVARVFQMELWYWGRYDTEDQAWNVAEEVGGIVLEDDLSE